MYHVNTAGEPRLCRATIACPFAEASEHYATPEAAREAFEASMASVLLPSSSRSKGLEATRELLRSDALTLAEDMAMDPDWLPPVDDPSVPDGVPEEEGYITSLEQFRDPGLAMGNCSVVADAVSAYTSGDYAYIEEVVDGPYLNVHAANLLVHDDGSEWVVDYTYSQVDPQAHWPAVMPKEEWLAAVHGAGFRPAKEVKALYEATLRG